MAVVGEFAHNDWFAGCATSGDGLIVMVNVLEGPVQPFKDGVTVIVAVTGTWYY